MMVEFPKPYICTADAPWKPEMDVPGQIIHPDAKEGYQDDDWYGGPSYVRMKCPHCGHCWNKELPQ